MDVRRPLYFGQEPELLTVRAPVPRRSDHAVLQGSHHRQQAGAPGTQLRDRSPAVDRHHPAWTVWRTSGPTPAPGVTGVRAGQEPELRPRPGQGNVAPAASGGG